MTKILVCGGRYFDKYEVFDEFMEGYPDVSLIIQGGAKGADEIAKQWAARNNVPSKEYPANWSDLSHPDVVIKKNRYGEYDVRAGIRRNQQMLDEGKPDIVLAMPGGNGTADMIRRSIDAKVPVHKVVTKTALIIEIIEPAEGD